MYLFRSLFITEKLYYFKVQFYLYLKEILSKENGNDLKIWPCQTDLFFLIIAGKCLEIKCEWKWLKMYMKGKGWLQVTSECEHSTSLQLMLFAILFFYKNYSKSVLVIKSEESMEIIIRQIHQTGEVRHTLAGQFTRTLDFIGRASALHQNFYFKMYSTDK